MLKATTRRMIATARANRAYTPKGSAKAKKLATWMNNMRNRNPKKK